MEKPGQGEIEFVEYCGLTQDPHTQIVFRVHMSNMDAFTLARDNGRGLVAGQIKINHGTKRERWLAADINPSSFVAIHSTQERQ